MLRHTKSNHKRNWKSRQRQLGRKLLIEGLEERHLMATFVVLNNNDDGSGSLREAIHSANTFAGTDTIEFAILSADRKISLQTALPWVTEPLVIDATTQPGFVDRPLVQIDGALISTANISGLYIPTGSSIVRGLSITNFANGIFVENLGGNKIEGNYLGLTPSGFAGGNRSNGIILQNSPGNIIGGATPSQRNVISSNGQFGVRVQNTGSTGNRIQGNFIGTDPSGVSSRPNQSDGVLVDNASETFIGTDGNGIGDAGEANLISGNTGNGVRLFKASNNAIAGNLIGVALNGSTELGNALGVSIDGGSSNNRIGTNGDGSSDALEKNIISGNSRGVELFDCNSSVIAGNYIGTSADGLHLVRNRGYGLLLSNSHNNRVGTNADGISDFLELNLISGNETNAIHVAGSDSNVFAGNWLGLSSDGETPIANGHSGMWIHSGSSDNLIGTNDDGIRDDVERNVISGNRFQGISIDGTYDGDAKTEKNVVAGNFIGTDKTGTKGVANETGVYLLRGAVSNVIGTNANSRVGSAAGNVISGNQFNGVLIRYTRTVGNQVAGNLIGLSADGRQAIGNNHAGVTIAEGPNGNFIGGALAQQANTIGANKNHGIWIVDNSVRNFVDGNVVGLAQDRVTPMGNGINGVMIQNSTSNRIGTSAANTIAHNAQSGIGVSGANASKNDLSKNAIFRNQGLAIDLGNDGPTSNDANDSDVGPNHLQNYPTLFTSSTSGSRIHIAGSLNSASNTPYRIEYFAKVGLGSSIDTMQYLGSGSVITDRTGQVNWVFELDGSTASNQSIIATATNEQTGTSEFSAPVPILSHLPLTIASATAREDVGNVQATVFRGTQPIGIPLTVSLSSDTPALVQVPATVEIPADQTSVTFSFTVINDTIWRPNQAAIITAKIEDTAIGSSSILISDDDYPWHNRVIPTDVSGEGAVSPLDAILVINLINLGRANSVYALSQPSNGSKLFADVNNDEVVSPIDALLVINRLNNRGNAEGEANRSTLKSELYPIEFMFDLALEELFFHKRRK